mgnify:CR=1 FL=1
MLQIFFSFPSAYNSLYFLKSFVESNSNHPPSMLTDFNLIPHLINACRKSVINEHSNGNLEFNTFVFSLSDFNLK